jgi:hypothetical protein
MILVILSAERRISDYFRSEWSREGKKQSEIPSKDSGQALRSAQDDSTVLFMRSQTRRGSHARSR